MRVLMLTASLPYPPTSGGALRALGILKCLHALDHDLTLLSFHTKSRAPDALMTLCKQVVLVPPPTRTSASRLRHLLLSSQPDIVQRMRSSALQARLEQLVHEQDFDVVQFEGIEMATYLPLVRGQKTRASLIFDTFNAEYRLQAQIAQVEARSGLRRVPAAFYSCIQAMRLKRYERGLCLTADATIAVSEEDAASLRPLCGSRPLHIVPSGLFVDDYAESVPIDLGSQSLVFTGKMDYRPNIDAVTWFAHAIFPHILKTIPDVVWYVVGQRPTAAVEALAEHPNIHVTDTVPDVVPYLSGAAVYIAPLRMGSGTRLKLLEAMAAGSAIVATPTAASGLDSETREAMNIADSEVAFAQAVTDLLSSPDKRRDYAERARRVVRARYDWSVLAPRLEAVYEDTAVG